MKRKGAYTIGFIGFGKMAQAIWNGLMDSRLVSSKNVVFCEKSPELQNAHALNFGIKAMSLNQLIAAADVILFCVKPQNIQEVLPSFAGLDLSQKCLISILAGTPISMFEAQLGSKIQFVRAMPNTPALLGAGMTVLAMKNVSKEFEQLAVSLFSALGEVETAEEPLLDVVTGISGSGPAFLYRIADQIAKMGRSEGLAYPKAVKLIAQTMIGAGKMLLQSGKTPAQLIQDVSSPGGTTVAGLHYFDQSQIDAEIQGVVKRSIERSRELGNKK